jgi:hypothetical protein
MIKRFYITICQQEQIKGTPQKKCHLSIHEVKLKGYYYKQNSQEEKFFYPYDVSWGKSSTSHCEESESLVTFFLKYT